MKLSHCATVIRKNFVKLTFYRRTLTEIDLTEKNLRGSEFLVFPHCAGQHCVCGKLFRQINSLIWCSAEGRAPTYYRGQGGKLQEVHQSKFLY